MLFTPRNPTGIYIYVKNLFFYTGSPIRQGYTTLSEGVMNNSSKKNPIRNTTSEEGVGGRRERRDEEVGRGEERDRGEERERMKVGATVNGCFGQKVTFTC